MRSMQATCGLFDCALLIKLKKKKNFDLGVTGVWNRCTHDYQNWKEREEGEDPGKDGKRK